MLITQDDIWMEKCLKLGWYLPYTPTLHEYAAWKHHYLACVGTMDSITLNDNVSNVLFINHRSRKDFHFIIFLYLLT